MRIAASEEIIVKCLKVVYLSIRMFYPLMSVKSRMNKRILSLDFYKLDMMIARVPVSQQCLQL